MKTIDTNTALTTPVLFLIFNRPDTTRKVFEAIRKVRPTKLYIAADGPRADREEDIRKCNQAREIVNTIDWECTVTRLFRDENLGCGKAPSSAMTWFFEHETEGIILEDDCLPSSSFFFFCAELLAQYRYDTRIMQIGGCNFEKKNKRGKEDSYYFSNMIYIWGWATWRRAWNLYNYEMHHYAEIKNKGYLNELYDYCYERDHYDYIFEKMYIGDERTSRKTVWDYQWQFMCKINSGLTIVPEKNLVVNLGFGQDATNTVDTMGAGNSLKMEEIDFPLKHPDIVMAQKRRDQRYFNFVTSKWFRIKSQIKNAMPRPVFNLLKPMYKKLKLLISKSNNLSLGSEQGVLESGSRS